MQPPTTAPSASVGGPWRALTVLVVLLAAEACLLVWGFGGWLRGIPGKQWATFAVLLMLGGLQSHVGQHRDDYRDARIRWPFVAGQVLAFAGVFALLHRLLAAAPPSAPGGGWLLPAAAISGLLWFLFSLAVIVPRLDLAGQLLGVAAALAALAGAAWSVGNLTKTFWHFSGGTTIRLVELLLGPLADGPVVQPEPFVIGTSTFQVEINDPCSGFHGIGLITTLLAVYLWWFRRIHRFPQSLLLLPVGMLLMWLANVVRITALILVGIWISPEIAVDGFHSAAGWIAFLTVGLGIIWGASRSPFFTTPEGLAAGGGAWAGLTGNATALPDTTAIPAADGAALPTALPTATCLLPFLALTGITMLARAFTSGFDVLYPIRVLVVAGVLWYLRRDFRWRECRVSPLAVGIGVATFALWMLLTQDAAGPDLLPANQLPDHPPADPRQLDPLLLGQPWATVWLFFRVVGSTITVPIAEELFFRGFVTRRCISDDVESVPVGQSSWFSFLVSSVAFGVLHGEAWIAGVVAGMMFAVALYSRRRLVDAVVAHATTNALLSAYVIATRSWSQWG